jgi:hypothetical protein
MNPQLTLQQATPRPAGMSQDCDAWLTNPNPNGIRLIRCKCKARRRVTIQTDSDCYTLKRCQGCADELLERVKRGATFTILEDEVIGEKEPLPIEKRKVAPLLAVKVEKVAQ